MKLSTNFRWTICSLLFFATSVNYLDRQVLSLTWKDFIAPQFNWTDNDYGTVTAGFSLVYAIGNLFAGRVVDFLGTKKGYMLSIFVWSAAACLHAACGWAARLIALGPSGGQALSSLQAGSAAALAVTSVSVWLFLGCRALLAIGEAGNFPAAIKVASEYFPKKDRAFATSIFNSGSSVGALVAPATIPLLAQCFGWEAAFVIIGALGFVWMGFWQLLYSPPGESRFVGEAELAYISQDSLVEKTSAEALGSPEKGVGLLKLFKLRHTWSLVLGRFLTDGVWWFFLFWTPGYFSEEFGYKSSSGTGMALVTTLYVIVTFYSIYLCRLPSYMIGKCGMNAYEGRMRSMLVFAFIPLVALFAQPLGAKSVWLTAVIIGVACAAHQAWSANIFSVVGDMFPKRAIGTVVGIAQCAAGAGSFLVNKLAGAFISYSAGTALVDGREVEMTAQLLASGAKYAALPLQAFGYTGKSGAYMIIFCYCAVAYLIGWICMKILVPRYRQVEL